MKSSERTLKNSGKMNGQTGVVQFESLEARQMFSAVVQTATPITITAATANTAATTSLTPTVSANIDFTVQNDWGSGYQGQISMANRGTAKISNWTLEFDFASTITQIWNAQIVSRQGNHYTIKNLGWNSDIAPNATVAFGFLGNPGNVTVKPTNYLLNGVSSQQTPPTLSIGDASVAEGNSGTAKMTFPVKLSAASTQTITVNYATSAGTATAGTDYKTTSGTLTFTPGQTSQNVSVDVTGDTVVEPDETFYVTLSAPTNATLGQSKATGTIVNDDFLPAISVANAIATEGNSGTTAMNFVVALSKASTTPVTVKYATADGTAKAGSDFTAVSGTLTFAAGETQKTVTVNVIGDTSVEADETLTLTLSAPTGATLATAQATGTITNDDVVVPGISVNDVSVTEGNPQTVTADGFFSTFGSQIVDSSGQTVKIAGVNWFGLETSNFSPHGLWTRGYKDMMDQMKQLGFNTIRLPFCNQAFDPASKPNSIDYSKNADLQGLTPIQILDKIVAYAGKIGMRILLDCHRSDAGAGPNGSGLWYTSTYTESRWINDWVTLATRYAGNPTVIGADLMNEPHGSATWGDGNAATDWRLAAQKAGNAILSANPNWLIVVEGIEKASSGSYWWGGNLSSAGQYPVQLNVANRLVYSPHDYPASIFNQTWFSDTAYPNNLPAVWDANWGYLFRQNIAPVLLGEFGTKLATQSDQLWLDKMVSYLSGDLNGDGKSELSASQQGISWTWWSWNPDSGDTGGILQDDWTTVNQQKLDKIKSIEFQLSSSGTTSTGSTTASFTVSLSQATTVPVTVNWATVDGTARAGNDYTAASGTLTFAPGETQKTISVQILADTVYESAETFGINLTSPVNGTITKASGTGTILDDDPAPVLPTVSVAGASVTEGNSGTAAMNFVVTLSKASSTPVTVNYVTADGTAFAGSDYTATSGTLTFAAGETQKTVAVNIAGDTVVEADETLTLTLSAPTGATLATAQATGTILNDDVAPVLPTLSIGDTQVSEGNTGITAMAFTVTLSQTSKDAVTVNYATADGTAVAGSDYTATSGTLTFAPGETQKTITVNIIGDTSPESSETLVVKLTSAMAAGILKASGQGTILDDDSTQAGEFNYAEVLQKSLYFYEAQRSGDLPDNYPVSWRGDSALADGSDVGLDLSGGYYDAGDNVKFGLPMASSMTMLCWGVVQYRDAYVRSGQLSTMLGALKWGMDWLIKCHPEANVFYGQVGDGGLDHAFWGAPEVMTMARPSYKIDAAHPGSDLAGEAAAAMAAASMVFRPTDAAYADLLLKHARELYNFADTYRGKYSDSIPQAAAYYNSYSGYYDELAWGGVWLYKATGEQSYLDKAKAVYGQQLSGKPLKWTQSWDDKTYGAAVLLAQATGLQTYKADAERFLNYWTVGSADGKITYTAGGLAYLDQWGSLRYAANTSFLALIYSDTVNDYNKRYHDFAVRQINYMLGDNPQNRSYVVGFGNNSPVNPHHRGASGIYDGNISNPMNDQHILYGALVGGPQSASDSDYQDSRTNYVCNEVALDYNAAFQGAIARLYEEYGGTSLATFPVAETPGNEFFVQAAVNQTGSTFSEIRAILNNRSAWPARMSSNLSFRYYVDLSEVYSAGYTKGDIQITTNYTQGATVSGLIPWDAAKNIYYVNIDFTGTSIGPGTGTSYWKEAQFRIGLRSGLSASAWNPANDWSYQGLSTNRDQLITSAYMPVYELGSNLLFGQSPSGIPGIPQITVDNASVVEGNIATAPMTFTVHLSSAATNAVTVNYATSDGTAVAGSDYVSAAGSLTFAPGETQKAITVNVNGDTTQESDETFKLVLSTPSGATLATSQAAGTIVDDDTPKLPTISASNANVKEGSSGTTPMNFTVALSAAASTPVTVNYATADGTAIAGSDYTQAAGSLTFAPGETQKTVTVNISGDTTPEADETLNLVLSAPSGATLATAKAVGTIGNDDAAPVSATVSYHVDNSWGSGFIASMTVANTGTSNINGWTVEFDSNYDITNIWNATIVSHAGTHYVIQNAAWNATVGFGGVVSFGFQGALGDGSTGPANLKLNGMLLA